jgi:hypothetical protein
VPPTDFVDFDGNPVKDCVALKRVKKVSIKAQQRLDNEVGILKEFATLENGHRRHLLTIYEV